MIVDFSNLLTFLIWYGITATFLILSHVFKKSILSLIPVIYFLVILGLSATNPSALQDVLVHRVFNFIGLALSLVLYIVIDDIETRRKIISQVFKNRYKNGDRNESDSTKS